MTPEPSFPLKDAIGLLADVMTLFGLSGFFTWSFVRKSMEKRNAADVGVSVFAMSVKTLFALVVLGVLLIPAGALHIFLVLLFSGDYRAPEGFWHEPKATAYLVSYIINALWFIPATVLSVASVYTWSIEPYRRFWQAFARNARGEG